MLPFLRMARGDDGGALLVLLVLFMLGKGKGKGKGGGLSNVVPIGPPGSLGVTYFPVTGSAKTISGYGPRGSSFHYGVDLGAPSGRAVVACVSGSVRFGTDQKGGNVAIVTAADGVAFYYAHLSASEGGPRSVNAGDVIGYVGNTGNASTTVPHLHFEVWPMGSYTPTPPDPTPFLQTGKRTPAQVASAGVAASNDGTAATSPAGQLPSNVVSIWKGKPAASTPTSSAPSTVPSSTKGTSPANLSPAQASFLAPAKAAVDQATAAVQADGKKLDDANTNLQNDLVALGFGDVTKAPAVVQDHDAVNEASVALDASITAMVKAAAAYAKALQQVGVTAADYEAALGLG